MSNGLESEQLWVGLGNPGKDYEQTRHNIGFMAITAIAEAHGFTPFKNSKKVFSEVAEGTIGGNRVRALLPQTYMNDSGKAVAAAARFWSYAPDTILVIHDELDLAAGKIRLKLGGGDAGHNGLRSITAALSTADYRRLRVGIGAPQRGLDGEDADAGATPRYRPTGLDYVLAPFSRRERETWLDALIKQTAEAAPLLLSGSEADNNRFINAVHNAN